MPPAYLENLRRKQKERIDFTEKPKLKEPDTQKLTLKSQEDINRLELDLVDLAELLKTFENSSKKSTIASFSQKIYGIKRQIIDLKKRNITTNPKLQSDFVSPAKRFLDH